MTQETTATANLSRWREERFEEDWTALKGRILLRDTGPIFRSAAIQETEKKIIVSRAKRFRFANRAFALVVRLLSETDTTFGVQLRVHSTSNSLNLIPKLKMAVTLASGETQQVESEENSRSLEIAIGDLKIGETFTVTLSMTSKITILFTV